MKLTQFDGQNKSELSMIEVARAILTEKNEKIGFNELLNEVQTFIGKEDKEIRSRIGQFYTDLNIDGSFISLGDNQWGLRSWYSFESINEAIHLDEEDGLPKKKKSKKINAFLDSSTYEDDIIDYNDDDPEDNDFEDDDFDNKENIDNNNSSDNQNEYADEVSSGIGEDIANISNKNEEFKVCSINDPKTR